MKAIISKKGIRITVLILGVAGVVAAAVLVHQAKHRHDQRMTSSCANHAIQLRFMVMQFIGQEDRFPLESDARSAFVKMRPKDQWSEAWLSSNGSSCPESYLSDKSIGYVFVADGLSTKAVAEHSALVFFCPAESHQRTEQHCHAVIGQGELLCIKSNLEMIEVLRREIRRGKEGTVPYSTNALSKMEQEMRTRESHARKQATNMVSGPNASGPRQLPTRTPLPPASVSSAGKAA